MILINLLNTLRNILIFVDKLLIRWIVSACDLSNLKSELKISSRDVSECSNRVSEYGREFLLSFRFIYDFSILFLLIRIHPKVAVSHKKWVFKYFSVGFPFYSLVVIARRLFALVKWHEPFISTTEMVNGKRKGSDVH